MTITHDYDCRKFLFIGHFHDYINYSKVINMNTVMWKHWFMTWLWPTHIKKYKKNLPSMLQQDLSYVQPPFCLPPVAVQLSIIKKFKFVSWCWLASKISTHCMQYTLMWTFNLSHSISRARSSFCKCARVTSIVFLSSSNATAWF
jgi:hypothetical protein